MSSRGRRGAGTPLGQRAVLLARRPTASRRLLPDFLIIGAQKCGTTTLHLALAEHPAIHLAFRREVHYYDWNYDRGLDWYRSHFPTRRVRTRSLRRRGEFATGEKSPYYLVDPDVPARVRASVPDIKLVVLLRDPVARAVSHYHHARRLGREPLSFEAALAREMGQGDRRPQRSADLADERQWRSYLARGRYAEQLERWLEHFDRSQLHVVQSERLFADAAPVVCEVQQFLGLSALAPAEVKPRLQGDYEPIAPALRLRLQAYFADDVRRLGELLETGCPWWSGPTEAGAGPLRQR